MLSLAWAPGTGFLIWEATWGALTFGSSGLVSSSHDTC